MTEIPFSESFALEGGGDLTLTRFPDGPGRIAIEKNGARCSFPLTPADMHRLSDAAVAMSLADHLAGFRS